jgi:hypothetical protein
MASALLMVLDANLILPETMGLEGFIHKGVKRNDKTFV